MAASQSAPNGTTPYPASRKLRLALMASGRGSNAQRIIKAAQTGETPHLEPRILLADKDCGAITLAQDLGVKSQLVRSKDYPSRRAQELALEEILRAEQIDLIALAGYMRLLTADFVKAWQGRIVNVHPALLPEFPGTEAIERAYALEVPFSGITVHLVDAGMDTGPILAQERVDRKPGMSLEDFATAMHRTEHQLYPRTLEAYAQQLLAQSTE